MASWAIRVPSSHRYQWFFPDASAIPQLSRSVYEVRFTAPETTPDGIVFPGSRPGGSPKERGGNSKTTRVIALLRRPQGATLQAIMKATGWQTHSVRGFISGKLKKKLGLKVRSVKREGKRVYSIKPH